MQGIEHAVNVGRSLFGGKRFGEFDGFVEDDFEGRLAAAQLVGSESQDGAVNGGHAFEAPIRGVLHN